MFEGSAEEAVTLYVSLFPGASVVQIERYPDGKVKLATFQIAGHSIHCIDSPVKHGFTFTPATSLFVECESAD